MEWTQEMRARLERSAKAAVHGVVIPSAAQAALDEIDRLTARVEALEGCRRFVAMLACSCPGPCETASDARDDCCAAHDALAALKPPGEEPAGNENFDRIMEGMKDAQAWAEAQSPRPPSESEVEAIARIIDEHIEIERRDFTSAEGRTVKVNVIHGPEEAARAILSHLTQAGK